VSELAFNMNGEPFEIPPTTTGWRVRRMKTKGAPEVVYGRDGTPLMLPLDASVEDLRNAVGAPGRYRVDPVEDFKPIPNAPAGYVFLHGEEPAIASASPSNLSVKSDNLTLETVRMALGMANTIVERFAQVMDSSATVLRAADGAGLPARQPRAEVPALEEDETDDDEDDDTPPRSPAMEIVNALIQVAPMIVTALQGKSLPKLDAVLDWRKAAPKRELPAPEEAAEASDESATDPEPPAPDAATMAKIGAILMQLTPAEAERARKLAAQLTPAEQNAYFAQLAGMSVPEALAQVRSLIGTPKVGGAS
jgi:hypothetical protein